MDHDFYSFLNLEETHKKEGYDEGHTDGLISGKEDGTQVGLKVGFEIGEELGFYRGCVDIWTSVIQVDPNRFSKRAKTGITQMEELLHKYPLLDPENLQVQEFMDSLRLKFKMIGDVHLPLSSSDIGVVQRIAKRISGRGGGLSSVQATTLAHVGGVIEVACNLLDPNKVGGERVQGDGILQTFHRK